MTPTLQNLIQNGGYLVADLEIDDVVHDLLGKQEYEKALGAQEFYVEILPQQPEALVQLANCYLYLENYDKALKALTKAFQLNPSDYSFLDPIYGGAGLVSRFVQGECQSVSRRVFGI